MYKKYFKIFRYSNNYIYNPNCFHLVYKNVYLEKNFFDISNILIEKMMNNKIMYEIPFNPLLQKRLVKHENQSSINYIIRINDDDIKFIIINNEYFNVSKIQEKVKFKLLNDYRNFKYFDRLKELDIESYLKEINLSPFIYLKKLKVKGNTQILIPYKISNQLELFWNYANSIKITEIPKKDKYSIFHKVKSLKLNKEIISNELILKLKKEISEKKWFLLWEYMISLKNNFSEFILGQRENLPLFICELFSDSSIIFTIIDGFNFSYNIDEITQFDFDKIISLDISFSSKPEIIDLS